LKGKREGKENTATVLVPQLVI